LQEVAVPLVDYRVSDWAPINTEKARREVNWQLVFTLSRLVGHWPIITIHHCKAGTILDSLHCRTSDEAAPTMRVADRFLKFASECQVMAQSAPQRENKRVWNGLAERWLRCAKPIEQLS
jgi:hypothetical protein